MSTGVALRSISPCIRDVGYRDVAGVGDEEEEDGDDEGVEGMPVVLQGERLGLERDEEVIRKLRDPKLPSEAEVENHWGDGASSL